MSTKKELDIVSEAQSSVKAKSSRLNAFMVQNAFSENFEEHKKKQQVINPLSNRIIRSLDVDSITRSPYQPRLEFDEEYIEELSKSISENGLIEVIKVRSVSSGYELVAGECRLLAHKRLGLKVIEAEVIQVSDVESAIQALAENIHRKNLSDLEIYLSLDRFESVFSTAKQVASLLEMSRAQFYRIKAFDKLPKSVIELLKTKPRLITALSAANIAKAIADLKAQGISNSKIEDALIFCIRDSVINGVKVTNIVSYLMERLVKKNDESKSDKQYILVGEKSVASFEHKSNYLQIRLDKKCFNESKEMKLKEFLEQLASDEI